MKNTLTPDITKYFWGDDLKELNWKDHKNYIIKIVLEKGDQKAARWLLKQVKSAELLELLPKLKLSKQSNNFWQIYLS